ncbi:MFS transporter [Microbacterium sp. cx-55]|uniref:MFS transporter n=1 Tax=unclassified Microbacterium TaxID=2609290 RepID=UPI001CBC4096|nr:MULTISPECIES: MFS transporter [unclassified Microbacterium]MBZ4486742.1 MFS transporter [Microbacterium sp. cx-55]MCC4907719.1 MFS transporter [Microbacterium sp. cx-59]UGB36301.1 MFS transporter [Microbacterium sp. cx-55]
MSTTPQAANAAPPGDSGSPGSPPRPWRVAIIAGLASFVDGAALSVNGIALVIYQQAIGLTPEQVGLLTAVVTVGTAIGALLGGRLGDVYGRRKVFIVTMAMIVIGTLGPIFSADFWLLFAGLALVGLGVGADLPVSLATIAEAATEKNRGAMLVFTQVLWITASLVVVIVASSIGGQGRIAGQILYGLVAVVGVIGLLLRLTLPESARWLASRDSRSDSPQTVGVVRSRVSDLLSPPLRRPLLVLTAFYALVSIPGGMLASYITYIAVNVAGVPVEQFVAYTAIAFPVGFLALFFFMKIVDTRFRRAFVYGCGLLTVIVLIVPVVFGLDIVSLLVVFTLIGGIGAICGEPITRVWSNESFPTMLRSTAQGFILTVGRLLLAASLTVGPALIAFSVTGFFLTLAVIQLLAVAVAYVGFRGGRIQNTFVVESDPAVGTARLKGEHHAPAV